MEKNYDFCSVDNWDLMTNLPHCARGFTIYMAVDLIGFVFHVIDITVTSHESYRVSDHRHIDCLYNSL